ncbi:SDR family oxidoreductase [Paenibacillus sp. N4]|uniref:SDR family NAD(P)-dependent oxidoreductase n=1 Tax=Paenibacillus vietnamensis TaxID=2590547 RepID=UPI001CD08E1D|nr:SDR family NAD(P)-dependent oxidoreductase [Paenibacillus vietnamensis]MCA0754193.1 SDR family oxidoreductase [Paenibacillus vietnamensis]
METMQRMFGLEGERVLITGGATGLGLAMSECFLAAGAEVIMVGSDTGAERTKLAEQMGKGVYYRSFNVADTKQTGRFIEELEETVGPISILVNNAGNHCKKPVEEMSDEDFRSVMDVHVMGAFSLCRALIPRMKERGRGSIIFQASMTSFIGQPYVVAYSSAKSAYLGMVRTLASETSEYGIRVNGIAPGWIETPMLHKALHGDEQRKQKILGRTPMKTFGKPQDIGWAAVYLASPAAAFVNGTVLPVDGGALIGF